MKRLRQLTLFSTIFLLIFSSTANAGLFTKSSIPQNKTAPDFTLKTLTGQDFSLKANRGKQLLLVFTTTWCSACRREIPELKKLSEKIDVVAIYINEPAGKLKKFIDKNQIPYTVLIDPLAGVAHDYEVVGVPTKVLIDTDGTVLVNKCISIKGILKRVSAKANSNAVF